jgi:class 3 adenylate cyclase
MDVAAWLRSLGLGKYEAAFRDNEVDDSVLPKLTAEDLKELGVTALGHRRKLLDAIAALRSDEHAKTRGTAQDAAGLPTSSPTAEVTGERRPLTVAFIDLVGSTVLGGELDQEDLIRLLGQYRETCVAAIGKYEGHVAQYLGDGILVYFGFPQAQEDAAERAVRAGLEIVEKVGRLRQPDGTALQARVGIVTGLVVTRARRRSSAIHPIWRLGFSLSPTPAASLSAPQRINSLAIFLNFLSWGSTQSRASATRFRSGRCSVRAQSRAGLQPLMPQLPVRSSDASASWHF